MTLLILIAAHCNAQVYSAGIYAGGHTYFELSSTALPFPPYKYRVTLIGWHEDTNGFTIMDVNHRASPGDVVRQSLEIQCGSETFTVPLDSVPPKEIRNGDGLPITKGSGDLAQLVMQCATKRGGRVTTNAFPVVQASWVRQSRPVEDVIVLDGNHFKQVQEFLEQAYGKPNEGISSSAPDVNGRSLTYIPQQIGVVLNLTGGLGFTVVSIIGKQ